jgi:hypothetical protein
VPRPKTSEGGTEGGNPEDEELMDQAFDFQDQAWPQIVAWLDGKKVRVSEINASGTVDEVFEDVRMAIDPFYAYRRLNTAAALTAEDVERSKDDERFDMQPAARLLRHENTSFCPVCLADRRLLVPGRDALGVRVLNAAYSCCSPRCVERMVANGYQYHINNRQ